MTSQINMFHFLTILTIGTHSFNIKAALSSLCFELITTCHSYYCFWGWDNHNVCAVLHLKVETFSLLTHLIFSMNNPGYFSVLYYDMFSRAMILALLWTPSTFLLKQHTWCSRQGFKKVRCSGSVDEENVLPSEVLQEQNVVNISQMSCFWYAVATVLFFFNWCIYLGSPKCIQLIISLKLGDLWHDTCRIYVI